MPPSSPGRNFFCPAHRDITMELAQQKCTTYKPGSPPLTRKETIELLGQVPGWALLNGHIVRTFTFPDAALCMKESRFVEVSFYTYSAGGLTLNDFIMAAKINGTGDRR